MEHMREMQMTMTIPVLPEYNKIIVRYWIMCWNFSVVENLPCREQATLSNGTSKSNGIGNIQGQQYVYRDDEKSVVNYAEILGKAFHVRAYGTCERDENDINEASAIKKDNSSMLDNVIGLFGGNKFPSAQKAGNMIN